jgi:hypothetical protein
MWKGYFLQTGSRIIHVAGSLIVLIVCAVSIKYIYFSNLLPDKQAIQSYSQTSCFLISKQIKSAGHLAQAYRADFLISYNVNGVQYNRWVSGNGMDMSFGRNFEEQKAILSRFDIGRTYPCWYNPANPQISVLILRHNWRSIFPLLVPSSVGLAAFYYLLANLSIFIGALTRQQNKIALAGN